VLEEYKWPARVQRLILEGSLNYDVEFRTLDPRLFLDAMRLVKSYVCARAGNKIAILNCWSGKVDVVPNPPPGLRFWVVPYSMPEDPVTLNVCGFVMTGDIQLYSTLDFAYVRDDRMSVYDVLVQSLQVLVRYLDPCGYDFGQPLPVKMPISGFLGVDEKARAVLFPTPCERGKTVIEVAMEKDQPFFLSMWRDIARGDGKSRDVLMTCSDFPNHRRVFSLRRSDVHVSHPFWFLFDVVSVWQPIRNTSSSGNFRNDAVWAGNKNLFIDSAPHLALVLDMKHAAHSYRANIVLRTGRDAIPLNVPLRVQKLVPLFYWTIGSCFGHSSDDDYGFNDSSGGYEDEDRDWEYYQDTDHEVNWDDDLCFDHLDSHT